MLLMAKQYKNLISAKRVDGKTTFISITSEAGEPCVLKTDMENPIAVGNKNLKINLF